ncbi:hypothetical protein [Actinokineospora sp.]|uniref:hypothetical protein n=1 Tax=Actinokineospora sp. TaxID=1872133 RepID=UPI003D6A520F
MTWPYGVLQQAGPAQFECLIHFTGRPSGRPATEFAPQAITDLTAQQKVGSILWDGVVWGFPPFGADIHHPMVCLSESPPEHLLWLLDERHRQPWGLLMWRQKVYDLEAFPPLWNTVGKVYLDPETRTLKQL